MNLFHGDAERLLSDIFDLSAWEVFEGVTNLDGALCPHCHKPTSPYGDNLKQPNFCEHCHLRYVWQRVNTPLGPAWQTWKAIWVLPPKQDRCPGCGASGLHREGVNEYCSTCGMER